MKLNIFELPFWEKWFRDSFPELPDFPVWQPLPVVEISNMMINTYWVSIVGAEVCVCESVRQFGPPAVSVRRLEIAFCLSKPFLEYIYNKQGVFTGFNLSIYRGWLAGIVIEQAIESGAIMEFTTSVKEGCNRFLQIVRRFVAELKTFLPEGFSIRE